MKRIVLIHILATLLMLAVFVVGVYLGAATGTFFGLVNFR